MLVLQKDVDSPCDWSLKWQLKFDAPTYMHVHITCVHFVHSMTYGNPKIISQYKMKEGDGKLTDKILDDEADKYMVVQFDG